MATNDYRLQQRITLISKQVTCAMFFICMNCSFVIQLSQLNENTFGRGIVLVLMMLGMVFLIFHLIMGTVVPFSWFVGTIVLIAIGIITYLESGSPTLLKLILFFYAVQWVEQKKVMKYFMVSLIIPLVIIVTTSLVGITEIRYIGLKDALRFGMTNPNTIPVIVFAIIIAYNLQHEGNIKYCNIITEAMLTGVAFYFCRARTAALVLTIYLLMTLGVKCWKEKVVRILLWPFQLMFPICAVFTIVITIAFRSYTSFWLALNNLLSGRLFLWNRYLQSYGISIWGNTIEFNQGSLDNAYMQLLIKYGIVTFAAYFVLFFIISRFAYKEHRMDLFVAVIATEIYCIAEFGPILINFCPVLIYLACILINEKKHHALKEDEVK